MGRPHVPILSTAEDDQGVHEMSAETCWAQAPTDQEQHKAMIEHMAKHGVFEAAERVMDQVDAGENMPSLSATEVRARLAPYLR